MGGFGILEGRRADQNNLLAIDLISATWYDFSAATSGTKPAPRKGHGFIAADGLIYLHGGTNSNGEYFGDLHMLDPAALAWRELSHAAGGPPPSPRSGHGMAVWGGVIYVHGGNNGNHYLDDLHALDLSTLRWSPLLAPGGPAARAQHCMTAWDGRLYLHGGWDPTTSREFDDFFVYDVAESNWTNLHGEGGGVQGPRPPARDSHTCAFIDDAMYLRDGWNFNAESQNDFFVFDPGQTRWTNLTASVGGQVPWPRVEARHVVVGKQLYLHAGFNNDAIEYMNDLHVLDVSTLGWAEFKSAGTPRQLATRQLSAPRPAACSGSRFTPGEEFVFLFGGLCSENGWTDELYSLEPDWMIWSLPKVASNSNASETLASLVLDNLPRSGHGLSFSKGLLFLHGGEGISGIFADLLAYNASSGLWINITSQVSGPAPTARRDHGFALCRGELFVHGGFGRSGDCLGDLLVLDIPSMMWVNISSVLEGVSPYARYRHGFASAQGRLYVQGGSICASGSKGVVGDLWEFDVVSNIWTNLTLDMTGDAPCARHGHGFAEGGGRLFLHGGVDSEGTLLQDLLVLDLLARIWTRLDSILGGNPPLARFDHSFATSQGRLLVHGGTDKQGNHLGDLYSVEFPKDFSWNFTTQMELVKIYDWDTIFLDPSDSPDLIFDWILGNGLFPSKLRVKGSANAWLIRQGNNSIYCRASEGCEGVFLTNVQLTCVGGPASQAFIVLEGSNLYLLHSTALSCSCKAGGALVSAQSGSTVTIAASVVQSMWSEGFGGALLAQGAVISVEDSSFLGCFSELGGGSLFSMEGSWMGLTNVQFTDSSSGGLGGAVAQEASTLEIVTSSFSNCSSVGPGSLVWSGSSSSLDMDSVQVDCIAAATASSLMVVDGSSLLLHRTNITNCWFQGDGGVIRATGGSVVRVWSSSFLGIGCPGHGSVFSISESKLHLLNVWVRDRGTTDRGGNVLWASSGSIVVAERISFTCDSRVSLYSLIEVAESTLNLTESTITGCSSLSDGAAIQSYDRSNIFVSNCHFTNIHSEGFGGAVGVYGSTANISNSQFFRITSRRGGGALWLSAFKPCYNSNLLHDTVLVLKSVAIFNCSTKGSGGAVQVVSNMDEVTANMQRVSVRLESTSIENCTAAGGGGALDVSGIKVEVHMSNTMIESCHSILSGGAISLQSQSLLVMVYSVVSNCSAEGSGGALLLSTNATVFLVNSFLRACTSELRGGGVYVGAGCRVVLISTSVHSCTAPLRGGGLFVLNSEVFVLRSQFANNSAGGEGGGGACLQYAKAWIQNSTFILNSAPLGGGGAVLWEGNISSPGWEGCPEELVREWRCSEPHKALEACHWLVCDDAQHNELVPDPLGNPNASDGVSGLCGFGNTAIYGWCLASSFQRLQVSCDSVLGQSKVFPGLPFELTLSKLDAYGQIIASDSSSLLQAYIVSDGPAEAAASLLGTTIFRLQAGEARISLSVVPTFAGIDFATDSTTLEGGAPRLQIRGQDSHTDAGEAPVSIEMQSAVLEVAMRSGGGVCPRGYVLDFGGAASRGASACRRCPVGFYSIHPLAPDPGSGSDVPACLVCPAGGDCRQGGDVVGFAVGNWTAAHGFYLLQSCPPSHQLIASTGEDGKGAFSPDVQECRVCSAAKYILHPRAGPCRACPRGALCAEDDGSSFCALRVPPSFPCPGGQPIVGNWTADAGQGVYVLRGCPAGHALVSAQEAGSPDLQRCAPCGAGQYIIEPDVDDCQPCPAGADCPDGSSFRPLVEGSVWRATDGIWTLESCPPGYSLGAQRCDACPPAAYCLGGALPVTPCGAGRYALPRSNWSGACVPAAFVVVTVAVPVLRQRFVDDVFQRALAAAAGLDPWLVLIRVVSQSADAQSTLVTADLVTRDAAAAVTLAQGLNTTSVSGSLAAHGMAGATLLSVHVTACPAGAELLESQTCQACPPNYYCVGNSAARQPCPVDTFAPVGAKAQGDCQPAVFVSVELTLHLDPANFTEAAKLALRQALAQAVSVDAGRVAIVSFGLARRTDAAAATSAPWMRVVCNIASPDAASASAVAGRVDAGRLNANLDAAGLPAATLRSVAVLGSAGSGGGAGGLSSSAIVGLSVSALVMGLAVSLGGYRLARKIRKQQAHREFLLALGKARAGDTAKQSVLPHKLRRLYEAESILGRGAFGCVVRAKVKRANSTEFSGDSSQPREPGMIRLSVRKARPLTLRGRDGVVAIKIIIPEKGFFEEQEVRQLNREHATLEMMTIKKVEHAVHYASGIDAVKLLPDACWFIMELLDGENMEVLLQKQLIDDLECIKVARSMLTVLKVLHAEGMVHRDIKPANIIRGRDDKPGVPWDGLSYTYKLVDFGTALGVDESLARKEMMTLSANRVMGMGTPPYMSPEMYQQPEKASYPTDLWSLGVTLFEMVTGQLPFEAKSDLLWSVAIAGDMDEKAPSVLDRLEPGRRAMFDHRLAGVVARALEKRMELRFASADEMHEGVYSCLVARGEACYSAFISYRVDSEAPLARLLFDELNHTVTPGGHRVTVFWDAHRLVKGEDWEAGFAAGLLSSLCAFPLLSYGATAPLARLPPEGRDLGWDERPLGRPRLQGLESDGEDNVLKELLLVGALLDLRARAASDAPAGGAPGQCEGEGGKLQLAYPILVGRQQPEGHPDYPCMGSFFQVQGGGGQYPKEPSPATNRAVAAILRDLARVPAEAVREVEGRGVEAAVAAVTRLQGCQLWSHPPDLAEAELNKEQRELVGKGYGGPPVDLGGVPLTAEQRRRCAAGGLDERQLRMLKAQVRAKRGDLHEVIDRAVSLARARTPADAADAANGGGWEGRPPPGRRRSAASTAPVRQSPLPPPPPAAAARPGRRGSGRIAAWDGGGGGAGGGEACPGDGKGGGDGDGGGADIRVVGAVVWA